MREVFWKYSEDPTNKQLSDNENNDSNFPTSKDSNPNPTTTIEDSMQKSKAYAVLNVLDSQWEHISKEDEKNYISILEKKDIKFLNDLTKKPKNEIKQFLIKAQIDKLENKPTLTKDEKRLRYNLKKQLIITKDSTIAIENNKQEDMRQAQDKKMEELKGALLSNSEISSNAKIGDIKKLFSKYDKVDRTDEKGKQKLLDEIIVILKTAWTLESITKDLGWVHSEEYETFKIKMLQVEPSLQEDFDRVELNLLPSIAKLKLGTSNIDGVALDSDTLSKTEDGVTTSYSSEDWRFLTGAWWIKAKSELNPIYEEEMSQTNNKTKEALKPLNESLNLVSKILDYLKNAKQNWEDFEEVKKSIQAENPDFYAEEWLDNITSFNEMIMILNARKYELEEETEEIKKTAREQIADIVEKSEKEAEEKDKIKKEMFKFFTSIGMDTIGAKKLEQIIDYMNIAPWKYGLQHKIDLDNWVLWFDRDFGDKDINPTEKADFIKLFNRIIWEDIVDENIAYGRTTLNPTAIRRLQVLNNKQVGYFMDNLNKETK